MTEPAKVGNSPNEPPGGPDADEQLRAAFRSQPDADAAPLPDDVQEQIWLAVSGDLDPDQRRALVDRTASDPAAAEVWRVASALWQARQEEGEDVRQEGELDAAPRAGQTRAVPVVPRPTRPWASSWTSPWLAAAAALVLVSAVVTLQYRRAGDEFRLAPDAAIESLVADDASLPRDDFRLRWTAGPEGARYRLRVTTEDLGVLATAAELTTPEFRVDPAALADLPPGTTVLWQVEMSLPTGQAISSRTFDARVR